MQPLTGTLKRTAAATALLLAATFTIAPPSASAAPNCTPSSGQGLLSALGLSSLLGLPYTCTNPVHPGANITVPGTNGGLGGNCTTNFVFDGDNDKTYIGTAGHCTLASNPLASEDVGEFTYPTGTGPAVTIADGGPEIGRIVYAIQRKPYDFALIELHPGVTPDAALPHWGPVTGQNNTTTNQITELRYVGHGLLIGDLLYARTAYALSMPSPDRVNAVGIVLPGDSGGPVVDKHGRAVGVNVALGVVVGSDSGTQVITRLAPQLARAAAATGVTYTIRTG